MGQDLSYSSWFPKASRTVLGKKCAHLTDAHVKLEVCADTYGSLQAAIKYMCMLIYLPIKQLLISGGFLFISLTSKRNRHHQQVLNATVHLPRPTPDHRHAHVPCAQEGLPCGPRVCPRGTATEHAILPLRHHQPPHLLTVLPRPFSHDPYMA